MSSRGVTATKNQLIELILIALGTSHGGMQALRSVLGSDPRTAVLDNSVDLQPVWQVLEAQPDFSPEAATAALCYVQSLEGRLGVSMRLPEPLAAMSPAERAVHATRCRPPRDEVERILAGRDLRAPTASTGAVPAVIAGPRLTRRQWTGLVAGGVAVISLVFMLYGIGSNLERTPRFERIDAADFAGDIPIGSARVWAGEVHASLVDLTWLRQPEERRRRQLEAALDRLSERNVNTLIIEDESNKQRASAQLFGASRKIQVRFY